MKNTKVLITVEGGIVQSVCSNDPNIKIVIIDYDDKGDDPVLVTDILEPDAVFKKSAKELFGKNLHSSEKVALEKLKEINF